MESDVAPSQGRGMKQSNESANAVLFNVYPLDPVPCTMHFPFLHTSPSFLFFCIIDSMIPAPKLELLSAASNGETV